MDQIKTKNNKIFKKSFLNQKDIKQKKLLFKDWANTFFYKQLTVDGDNIFTTNITEKNEVENVKFKKSQEHGVTGLSINHDIGSALESVTDIEGENFLSNTI